MMEIPPAVWAAFIAFVGSVVGLAARRFSTKADAASTLTDGAMSFVNELQEEQARLRAEAKGMRQRLDLLELEQRRERDEARMEREWYDRWIAMLVATLHRHGIEVPASPPRPKIESE